jgi:hypothetical protein
VQIALGWGMLPGLYDGPNGESNGKASGVNRSDAVYPRAGKGGRDHLYLHGAGTCRPIWLIHHSYPVNPRSLVGFDGNAVFTSVPFDPGNNNWSVSTVLSFSFTDGIDIWTPADSMLAGNAYVNPDGSLAVWSFSLTTPARSYPRVLPNRDHPVLLPGRHACRG